MSTTAREPYLLVQAITQGQPNQGDLSHTLALTFMQTRISCMHAQLQKQERERHTRIAIHHYLCDHIGMPMALTDHTGPVAWIAKLDPWGNVL